MLRALDFRERTRIRRFVYAKPTILAMFVLSLLSLHGAWGMYLKSKEALANRDKAVLEANVLMAHQQELHADIGKLSSDRGQEEEIRNRFMVAKDGEKVIIVSEPDDEVLHSVTVDDSNQTSTLIDRFKAAVGLSGN
jgi:cell division protein FtsB